MATLQKIRNNKITQIAIGLGMLAFIAGSAVEIMKHRAPDTEVASINGESLNYAQLNEMVDEYKNALQLMGQLPQGEVNNEINAQIREQVYQRYLQLQLLKEECDKLGITITDAELQNTIKSGSHPLLSQTPFTSQQGAFDYAALQQFLNQRNEALSNGQMAADQRENIDRIYNYWCFIEKEIKNGMLMEKYQTLLGNLMMSNPTSAKANFNNRKNETDIVMAALPYTSIEDNTIKVEDSELQAKFNEYKDVFYQANETRDIKYIDVFVKASKGDEEALKKEMAGYAEAMKKPEASIESIVRQSQSTIPFFSTPVSRKTLPTDVAERIDSMSVGEQSEVYVNIADNTMNIVKLLNKTTLPDSVEVRQLAIATQDEAGKKTADSIYNALQNGANFDTIAKAQNQPATKQWITSNMYEGRSMDANNKKIIETATNASLNAYNKIDMEGGLLILQVTDRRNMIDKFEVAVIKRTIDFSNETSSNAFNELSSFIASNKTIEEMEKSAQKANYTVLERTTIDPMTYTLPGIEDSREVIRWAFKEETRVGDVSEIMYCGKSREHLVVAVVTGTNEAGYLTLSNKNVKEYVNSLVMQDKKAAQLQDKMKNAKSLADVTKINGAVSDTIQHITFSAPVYLQKMGAASEPALSGAASLAAKGKFVSGIRGNAGVYAFQVIDKKQTEEKYDEKAEMKQVAQQNMALLGNMFQADLQNPMSAFYKTFKNAKKQDKRHLFY